jgi:dimethylaniline monooxygenase (N-oxide forming)
VAVLGAGPADLASAQYLLEHGLCPVLFDRAPDVGGLWRPGVATRWKKLHTNLSRLSMRFSNHAWPESAPMFPSRPEVMVYLSDYASRFLGGVEAWLGCTVTSVRAAPNG